MWFCQTRSLVMLFPVNNFLRQSFTLKAELVPLESFWHTIFFTHLTCFWMKSNFKTNKLIDSSPYSWCFLLWLVSCFCLSICGIKKNEKYTIHISAIVSFSLLQTSCYKLYVYFRNFSSTTITQMSSLKLKDKTICEKSGTQMEEAFFDGIRGDVQLKHFIILSVPVSQKLHRLTTLYFFSFFKWLLKHDRIFCWEQSGGFETLTTAGSRKKISRK